MFGLWLIGKTVVDRVTGCCGKWIRCWPCWQVEYFTAHSTHLTMSSSWNLIVRLMQAFYLSCLTGGNTFLNCYSTWNSRSLPGLPTPGLERVFCVGGRVVDTGDPAVWEWLWEEDMGQSGLAPFAVPEHVTARWLC